MHRYYLQ